MTYQDTREDIYYLIKENPGIHFRGIAKELNREVGVIDYHIQDLERDRIIVSVKYRSLKIYFDHSWEKSLHEVKIIVANLKKNTTRSLLLLLGENKENQNVPLKELATILGKSPSNLHWHVKRMIDDRIVRSIRRGREVTLKLNVDNSLLHRLGNLVFPSKWDLFIDEIHDRLT